jgi:hypothetical protein
VANIDNDETELFVGWFGLVVSHVSPNRLDLELFTHESVYLFRVNIICMHCIMNYDCMIYDQLVSRQLQHIL